MINCMGHVSGLEKYECLIWKVCMRLSRLMMEVCGGYG